MKVSEQVNYSFKEILTTVYEKNNNQVGNVTLQEVIEEIKALLTKLEK